MGPSNSESDELVVLWDYVDFLLENLSKIKKNYKIKRSIEKSIVSPFNEHSPPNTLHFYVQILIKKEGKNYSNEFQINYFSYKSERIVKPYFETSIAMNFIDFLQEIFGFEEVNSILIEVKTVEKGNIPNEEISINKTKYWNFEKK